MQNKPEPTEGRFKQIYYKQNRDKPYTTCRAGEDDYLQTDVWREIRDKRLLKDSFRCRMCGSAINVVVHHIRYPLIWGTEDIDNDLITLCRICHNKIHAPKTSTEEMPY